MNDELVKLTMGGRTLKDGEDFFRARVYLDDRNDKPCVVESWNTEESETLIRYANGVAAIVNDEDKERLFFMGRLEGLEDNPCSSGKSYRALAESDRKKFEDALGKMKNDYLALVNCRPDL